ncbi:MAG: 23S rRNA (uracil(1939)-C(5))-methyltransferase RlmD [Ruminococcus sp.]|nr:23S rRNA (uracil(1939)-C(5))-methyltransferase RlmD [Ruminococcus sp.]
MQKNEIYTVTIEDLTAEGSGVCRVDGMTVFVPETAVGDVLEMKIVKVLKRYSFGIPVKILTPSPDRMEPDCKHHCPCGGCTFRHIRYENELELKAKIVQDAFQRLGKLSPEFLPILGCDTRIRYRNKAQYPVAADKDGKLICGFYAKRSHRIVPVEDCLLQPERFGRVVKAILRYAEEKKISAYDEVNNTGILRHIYLREGHYSGELMVCLVVRKSVERELKGLIPRLTEEFPQIKSIVMNVNPEKTNVILGRRTVTLYGSDTITDTMCGNEVSISPLSFYQVNTPQAERLYGVAKEFAALTGTERLLDLYCGAGTIGLSMADAAGSVLGVEVIPEAVENARENASRNGIRNAQFLCGDAGEIAARLAAEQMLPDVIVADPPRKGCDAQTIDAICRMNPERVVMVSCNPATAARDCALLCQRQYQIVKVQPVDLFPGTGHVECVVLLSRDKA